MATVRGWNGEDPPDDYEPDPPLKGIPLHVVQQVRAMTNEERRAIAQHLADLSERKPR
jgi:hypothetical protein